MDNQREQDQFARIKLHSDLQRYREIVVMYQHNLAEYHEWIEDSSYKLGMLDERLGSDEA